MIYLKAMTNQSWLLYLDETSKLIGMLSKSPNGTYFMIFDKVKTTFKNIDEVNALFGFDVFSKKKKKVTKAHKSVVNYINGYPVVYSDVVPQFDKLSGLPTFTKSPNSNVLYCAGYYCLKREKGWAKTYCSKLKTLEKYDYQGPFKTSSECKKALTTLKKKEKGNKK